MSAPAPLDRKTVKSVAKKTLGHSENSTSSISLIYLVHLREFLSRHSDETHFQIALDHGGDGAISCHVCDCIIPPGDGVPEEDGKDIFGSLQNYELHIRSPEHTSRKAQHLSLHKDSGTVNFPPPVSSSSTALATINTRAPRVVVDLTESPELPHTALSSSSFSGVSSDFEPQFTLDSDHLYALQLHNELNGITNNQASQSSDITRALHPTPSLTDNLHNIPEYSPRSDNPVITTPTQIDSSMSAYSGPTEINYIEEMLRAQLESMLTNAPGEDSNSYLLFETGQTSFQARCKHCHFSTTLPAIDLLEDNFKDLSESLDAYERHLKMPHHIRARNGASQHCHIPPPRNLQQQSSSGINNTISTSDISSSKRKVPEGWIDDLDEELDASRSFENHGFTSASAFFQTQDHPSIDSLGLDYHNPSGSFPRPMVSIPPRPKGPIFGQTSEERIFSDLSQHSDEEPSGIIYPNNNNDTDIDNGHFGSTDFSGSENDKKFREFMNNALEDFKDNVPVAEAQTKLGLQSQDELLPGMSVRLLPHQIIGVSWMLEQEKSEEKLGGILADSMGLGKTVQMIATMAANRSSRTLSLESDLSERLHLKNGKGKQKQKGRRTTLVIAPASLLQQWYEEITEKTNGIFRVHIHHGKEKLKSVQEIEGYDVIIASHQAVVMDFPKPKPKRDQTASDEEEYIPVTEDKRLGPLARTPWFRIVIDEAQAIRNRFTRISVNVAKLDSRYRWCLTGTPVTNSLTDIFGYMRFCQFAPWDSWKEFYNHIAKIQRKQPNRAGQRTQTILRPHLLRRTKDSKIDGQPIIQLGPKDVNMIELEFTQEELELYKSVEARQKQKVSRFFREGSVMKNYHHILLMVLRLRQLCCHPSLVVNNEGGELDIEVGSHLHIEFAHNIIGKDKVDEIKRRFLQREVQRAKAEQSVAEVEEDECAICMEPFVNNRMITACAHEFCSVCINEVLRASEGGETDDEAAHCPLCRKTISKNLVFPGTIFEPGPEEIEQKLSESPGYTKRPSKKARMDDSAESDNEPDVDSKLVEEVQIEVSTKMRRMLESILRWKAESPDDKLIIYSQWTSMLDIIDKFLGQKNIETLRYDGRMSRVQRVEAVAQFRSINGPSIMLISLKCGGVGLNLTVANRVINLDLAWNYATEAQAYDRVHRLGQHKAVTVERLIVKNTIEERIVKLQEKKQNLSDAALGEGSGGKLRRMTPREIAQLFDLRV